MQQVREQRESIIKVYQDVMQRDIFYKAPEVIYWDEIVPRANHYEPGLSNFSVNLVFSMVCENKNALSQYLWKSPINIAWSMVKVFAPPFIGAGVLIDNYLFGSDPLCINYLNGTYDLVKKASYELVKMSLAVVHQDINAVLSMIDAIYGKTQEGKLFFYNKGKEIGLGHTLEQAEKTLEYLAGSINYASNYISSLSLMGEWGSQTSEADHN